MAVKQAAKSSGARVHRLSEIDMAVHLFHTGKMVQAEATSRAILAGATNDAQGLHRLGMVADHFKRHHIAAELIGRVIALRPKDVQAHTNLSGVLRVMGRLAEAAEVCRRAIAVRPDFPETYTSLGQVLRDQGLFADALAAYRSAIALDPNHAAAHLNLGLLLSELDELDAALAEFQEVTRIQPNSVDAHRRIVGILRKKEQLEQAADYLRRAIEEDPHQSVYHAELALTLTSQGRLLEAVEAYRKALAFRSDDTAVLNNLGNLLDELGRLDEAAAAYQFSVQVDPQNITALSNLGIVLRKKNRIREAIGAFRKVLALNPASAAALGELYQLRLAACDWKGIADDEAAVLHLCHQQSAHDMPPFILLAAPNATAADRMNGALLWTGKYRVPESRRFSHPAPFISKGQKRKIRVGYLSADFYNHATAFLAAELFERHDRSRFDIIAYSHSKDDHSAMRQRLVQAFDEFVDISLMGHPEAAQRINNDRIDILIDLKGHTQDARTQIFAYRSAPIQVNYLGYPGTMGADFIDYIIGDPTVTPMDQQSYYKERIVQLPHCYQPNDTKRDISLEVPTRVECGLPEGAFVFCCFNNTYKLIPALFDIWMRLLKAVPGSVLWLIEANDVVKHNLRSEAAARGVDPARLVFALKMPVPKHLARHCHADLFLDTLPYNAHTTASDALWAGLPIVTCLGDSFAGRVAASLLRSIGMPELVTFTLEEYEGLALKLATQPSMLSDIRRKLIHNRLSAPVFDIETYSRDLERAYTRMVEIWQSGRPPEAFAVADLEPAEE
ncbi:tetratricopeptide repeat protein [Microvirga lenta]|uniref:tetratricopeptide repeat protein n=1 Tax=Microvirga lenta TaxID=2881337 RepID=UPI001CFCBE59|nr:tetratricopeptide repeat protein [Microvirga lenta]MCB5173554.1 tetratricopeptide repeat protein [Microvirga lenta]